MDRKQYNQVIEHTLKQEQVNSSLRIARAIFNNMGISLPQGDIKTVYETLKNNDFMGWRACKMLEAQQSANNGVATIGISDTRIVVISANNTQMKIPETLSTMTLSKDTLAYAVSDLEYYSHSCEIKNQCGDELIIMDKPYDISYPYDNISNPKAYYNCLKGYQYEIWNDFVYEFTFEELSKFRAHLSLLHYERSTEQEMKQLLKATIDEVYKLSLYIPQVKAILSLLNTASTIDSLQNNSVQNSIKDIRNYVDSLCYCIGCNKVYRRYNSVVYKISLLMKNGEDYEIKIESSKGEKEIYTLQKNSFEVIHLVSSIYANNFKIYKVAPNYTYYHEI